MVPNCRCAARHETVIEKEINSSPISSYLMLPLDLDRGKIVDRLVESFCELNCRHEFWRNQTKPTYIIDIDPTLFFSVHIIILGVSIFFMHVFIFVCLVYIKKKST